MEANESAGWKRGPVSECFIISNVAFPEALSKVSELREPGLETLNPLVTTWSKATLHFLKTRASAWIMCLNTVVLFI